MKQGIAVAFATILLTACNQTPSPAPSPQASEAVGAARDRCATDFIVVTAATPACGIALGADGSLTAGDHRYPPVIASYQQGADGDVAIPARKLILFPAAPQSGRRIIQACEDEAAESLCWAVRLVKPTSGVLQNVVAGKYGPERWLSWSPNERHVALFSQSEGAQWLYIVDTATGSTLTYPDASENANWQIDRGSFAWTGDDAFTVKVKSCEACAFETRSFTLP
jgi:Tol biopolymer transport system component